jgi:transcriptional regulator with XRE-family HTH domain
MVELSKKNLSKRIIFPSNQQQKFLSKALKNLNLSWSSFAEKIGIHKRTLSDWKREKYSMPFNIVKKISEIAKVKIPFDIKIKEPFWYVYKSAKNGGVACLKKYGRIGGNSEYRKKKWYEWWEREGKYKPHPIINTSFPIKKPKKSKNLAEFVGIVLGDGGITQYQVTISFHQKYEKEYRKFVVNLIKKLFGVPAGVHYDKKCLKVDLNISRVELVRFCTEKLGLRKGNKVKQQVDIPEWIKQNKLYSIACVRGLIDTDGCVFTHRYKVKGKLYNYKKLSFTNYSKPLRQFVFSILKNNGLHPRFARRKDVRLDSKEDMHKYFRIFKFHNPRHLKRYLK